MAVGQDGYLWHKVPPLFSPFRGQQSHGLWPWLFTLHIVLVGDEYPSRYIGHDPGPYSRCHGPENGHDPDDRRIDRIDLSNTRANTRDFFFLFNAIDFFHGVPPVEDASAVNERL